jgi:hypothetical protein
MDMASHMEKSRQRITILCGFEQGACERCIEVYKAVVNVW